MDSFDLEKAARRRRISEEIAEVLKRKGMTQKEFAGMMDRVPSEVTKWLNGRHNFTTDLLAEISAVLGVEISGIEYSSSAGRAADAVCGYGCEKSENEVFEDGASYIDGICLPAGVAEALVCKARRKGVTLREYIRTVLTDIAAENAASAFDFCGIWGESYPDIDEIRAARTQNSFPGL